VEGGKIALLSSAQREPGQRGLFRHLKFTGAPFSEKVTKKQKKGWLERTARFRGLRDSANIKTYVTSVELVDWTSGHPEPLVRQRCLPLLDERCTEQRYQIWECGEALFEMLQACPTLTHVECTNMLFKTSGFQSTFARKAVMETIILRDCTIPLDETEVYQAKSVQVIGPKGLSGFAAENYRYAIASLLAPQHLRRLRLDIPDMVQDLLPLLIAKDKFTALQAAEFSVPSDVTWPELDHFAERCPDTLRLALTHVVIAEAPAKPESPVCINCNGPAFPSLF
jgi:hypothetical protein